jgi:tetratricopeptide (TPR) repeat protein
MIFFPLRWVWGTTFLFALICLSYPNFSLAEETADGFLTQGLAFNNEGEYQKAIAAFKRALELDPAFDDARLNLGIAYFKAQSFDSALATFQQILDQDPNDSSALIFLGLSLQEQEQYEKSIPYFEKAGNLDPDFHQLALFNIGKAHSQLGRNDQANKNWNEAVKADPTSEIAEGAKALLKAQSGKKPQKPWSLSLGAGYEYDDNITVDELNQTTNLADFSYLFELEGSYKFLKTPKYELEAGYSFFQSVHDDLASFDLQSHIFSLNGSYEWGKLNFGIFNIYNLTNLGADEFLEIYSTSPSVGLAVNEKWFATFTYSYKDTHFFDSPLRDAQNHGFALGNFLFIMDGKGMIQVGYRFENEITTGPAFDYWGHYVDSKVQLPLPFSKNTKISLSYQYFFRDFKNVTASIGETRDDFRHTIGLGVIQPIYKNIFGKLNYQFIDSTSNLTASDFKENIASISLGVSF